MTTAGLNVIQSMGTDRGVKGLADPLLTLMEMNVCVCGGAVSVGHRQMDNMLCKLLCVPNDITSIPDFMVIFYETI